jgi:ribonuclease HI
MSNDLSKKVLVACCDGGARNNPGPAAVGVVIYEGKEKVSEISKFIGTATNNVAEYMAFIFAAFELLCMKPKKAVFHLDSQLVARQLKGEYKVRNRELIKFYQLASSLIAKFMDFEIKEVSRKDNKEADALVNRALDFNTLV